MKSILTLLAFPAPLCGQSLAADKQKPNILFTSDNGGNMYNEVDGTTPTSNAALRGGKATMFDCGTRVPCVIAWPGITAAGIRSEASIQSEDLYPTLLAGLGLKAAPDQRFDGISILPVLEGGALTGDAIFQYFPHNPGVPDWLPPAVSVHRGDWKLIRIFHGGDHGAHRHLLFNLRDNIGEKANLAAQRPELVGELDALITHFLADTKAVVPVPNPAFDPAKYRPELEGKQKPKGKPGAKTSRADAAGWQTSKDAQLTGQDGVLHIKSTGNDPWIGTRALPANTEGPFTVKLRLQSTGKGNGVVYFSARNEPGFNIAQSTSFPVKHDGEPHDYEIKLPTGTLTALRLDPGNARGEIVIALLELIDANGRTIVLGK